MNWREIPGWCEDEITTIYDLAVERAKDGDVLVELSSYKGRSTKYMTEKISESGKNLFFYAIDTWMWDCHLLNGNIAFARNTFGDFIKNVESHIEFVKPINFDSIKASSLFEDSSVSFLFLDTDHSYEHVKKEIDSWIPKMKADSIISGHDYLHPGCKMAVDEFFPDAIIKESSLTESCKDTEGNIYTWNNSSWYYEKIAR